MSTDPTPDKNYAGLIVRDILGNPVKVQPSDPLKGLRGPAETIADLERQLSDTRRRLAEVEKERAKDDVTILRLIEQRNIALADKTALRNAADGALQALAFYADPDSYFAIMILPDHPAGEFADDFSEDHGGDYDRPMPGKLAREAIKAASALISEGNQQSSDSNSPTASRESQG